MCQQYNSDTPPFFFSSLSGLGSSLTWNDMVAAHYPPKRGNLPDLRKNFAREEKLSMIDDEDDIPENGRRGVEKALFGAPPKAVAETRQRYHDREGVEDARSWQRRQ